MKGSTPDSHTEDSVNDKGEAHEAEGSLEGRDRADKSVHHSSQRLNSSYQPQRSEEPESSESLNTP